MYKYDDMNVFTCSMTRVYNIYIALFPGSWCKGGESELLICTHCSYMLISPGHLATKCICVIPIN